MNPHVRQRWINARDRERAAEQSADLPAPRTYVVSVDAGRTQDNTAVVVVEIAGEKNGQPLLEVVGATTYPLGADWSKQALRIVRTVKDLLAASAPGTFVHLVLDRNGNGEALIEALRRPLLKLNSPFVRVVGFKKTSGTEDTKSNPAVDTKVTCSSTELNRTVRKVAGNRRITAGPNVDEQLVVEMRSLEDRSDPNSPVLKFAVPGSAHDDLWNALAMGVWVAEKIGAAPTTTISVVSPLRRVDRGYQPGEKAPDATTRFRRNRNGIPQQDPLPDWQQEILDHRQRISIYNPGTNEVSTLDRRGRATSTAPSSSPTTSPTTSPSSSTPSVNPIAARGSAIDAVKMMGEIRRPAT